MVGTSGISGMRAGLVTASARTSPDLMCGTIAVVPSNVMFICPANTSMVAWDAVL